LFPDDNQQKKDEQGTAGVSAIVPFAQSTLVNRSTLVSASDCRLHMEDGGGTEMDDDTDDGGTKVADASSDDDDSGHSSSTIGSSSDHHH